MCIQSSSEFLKATWGKDEEAKLIISLPFWEKGVGSKEKSREEVVVPAVRTTEQKRRKL